MQTEYMIAILLTRRGTVVKVPTLCTTKRMRGGGCFEIGTGGRRTFGIVSPPLWGLVFGVPHKADTEKLALHRIPGVTEHGCRFVEDRVGEETRDGATTFCLEAFENIVPTAEHVPILVEDVEHRAAAEDRYELVSVNRDREIVESVPCFTGDRGQEFFAFKMDDRRADIRGRMGAGFRQPRYQQQCVITHGIQNSLAQRRPLFGRVGEHRAGDMVQDKIDLVPRRFQRIFHLSLIGSRNVLLFPNRTTLQEGSQHRLLPDLINSLHNILRSSGLF